MSATALYRALVDAGAGEHLAKEAVESVVYAPEAATRSDLAEFREATRSDFGELRVEFAEHREATRSDFTEFREAARSDFGELRMEFAEHREATRSDIAELRMEMTEFKMEVKTEIAEFKTELRTDIADFKTDVRADIAEFKVDVERGFRGITWRFVGLLIATQALLFTALRLTGTG